jgi:hypothetical protein
MHETDLLVCLYLRFQRDTHDCSSKNMHCLWIELYALAATNSIQKSGQGIQGNKSPVVMSSGKYVQINSQVSHDIIITNYCCIITTTTATTVIGLNTMLSGFLVLRFGMEETASRCGE